MCKFFYTFLYSLILSDTLSYLLILFIHSYTIIYTLLYFVLVFYTRFVLLFRLISNVEDFGCPSLEETISDNRYFCFNHDLCIRRKPMCAVNNVVSIRAWLLNYLNDKFGHDVVDSNSKKDICSCLYWR